MWAAPLNGRTVPHAQQPRPHRARRRRYRDRRHRLRRLDVQLIAYIKFLVEDAPPLLNALTGLGLRPVVPAEPAEGCRTTIMRGPGFDVHVSAPVTATGAAQDWLKENGPGVYEIGVYGDTPGAVKAEGGIRIITVPR